MNSLPHDYLEQMKELLRDEYPVFIKTYEQRPTRGLRINTLKISPEEFTKCVPFQLNPIPWCNEAFYYQHEVDRPGKHVYHAAGLYYIQDASAMAPAEALEPQPGERILDLCAAPGGKTTQIAAKMKGQGILVANEIDPIRIKALVENLERCGVTHAVVLNENPVHLTKRFRGFFDRILIDAPCSGEGMFRKDHDVCDRWSLRAVEKCADLQLEILAAAAPMLRPGGRLVYSTCTFNPTENESTIQLFLEQHPDFALIPVPQAKHYQPGRTDWVPNSESDLNQASRLWPHYLQGEGHFVACLEKRADSPQGKQRLGKLPPVSVDAVKQLRKFTKETYREDEWSEGNLTLFGEHLYQVPVELPSLKGIRVERPGRYLGQVKKGRFVPSHALACSSRVDQVIQSEQLAQNDPQLLQYLQGEAIPTQLENGWTLVAVEQFPLGWAKASGGLLKNHYPKWMRWKSYA
ncbi:RsmB/NOP family class I SAM-dependent RNA methyltransferase [Hazenella coriacea]|uniref:16S rRNA (Cytosine(967)-C(5))-methyltransferase n=1 Tax=Hazenella coriacea TaxID=1179467 RepID=A0A4V2UVQ5_9BACL|nr:RsmB/NOP family class I SAM-dependent RNA methyltransferase [Hazenella coriacea]TCS96667.1 16S rRNA (cytosine(967)-C(5))-methyltransferase [Hazenella coriacea]